MCRVTAANFQRKGGPVDSLKDRLKNGDVLVGAWCMVPSALTAEILAKSGFDWILIDMQHGCMDYETAVEMIRAVDIAGLPSLVRVPWNEPGIIGRMLDGGAAGIVAPMIQTPADAEKMVEACLYPPVGRRSLGPIRVGARDGAGYFAGANKNVLVVPMIETSEALESVEEIAAVPGVGGLLVGPFDLSLALGLRPGDNDGEPAFDAAVERVNAAAKKAGIATAVLSTSALTPRRAQQGFQLISALTDAPAFTGMARMECEKAKNGLAEGEKNA